MVCLSVIRLIGPGCARGVSLNEGEKLLGGEGFVTQIKLAVRPKEEVALKADFLGGGLDAHLVLACPREYILHHSNIRYIGLDPEVGFVPANEIATYGDIKRAEPRGVDFHSTMPVFGKEVIQDSYMSRIIGSCQNDT